jgi:redox-sensing transcriptional repressor
VKKIQGGERVHSKKNGMIPKATGKRLAIYYSYLKNLNEQKVLRVNSKELSEALQVDSATIRRDFSYFGELGKRGYGYDVKTLIEFFSKTLTDDQTTKVAVVGVGNLGSAILKNEFYKKRNMQITAAFDKDPEKVGLRIGGVEVQSQGEMSKIIKLKKIEVAILMVPDVFAQEVADELIKNGVRGILNFTAHRIVTKKDSNVVIQTVDLTSELQTLIYFMNK